MMSSCTSPRKTSRLAALVPAAWAPTMASMDLRLSATQNQSTGSQQSSPSWLQKWAPLTKKQVEQIRAVGNQLIRAYAGSFLFILGVQIIDSNYRLELTARTMGSNFS